MNVRRLSRLVALPLTAAAIVVPAITQAQEPQRNVTVRDRPRPDFDPRGIRAGSFLIFPSVDVVGSWDDNIFASDDDTIDDFIVTTIPSITAQSNFSQHSLRFRAFSDVGRYKDEDSENYFDFGGEASGRLDIRRDIRLLGGVAAGRNHLRRDDPEDTDSSRPVRYYYYDADLDYQQLFNRINVRVGGDFNRRDYRNAQGNQDQDERDRNIYGVGTRVGYFISPRINLFGQGRYFLERRDKDQELADGSTRSRDSEGFEAAIGTEIDITGLLFGEIYGGYTQQWYDSGDFDNENGFSYGIGLTWNPTGLTSVGLDGFGGFEPTDTGEASSRLVSSIGLSVDHELLRNLILGAEAGYRRDDFNGVSRTDNRYQVGGDVTYLINRNFSVSGGYSYTTRKSDLDSAEFNRNLVQIRLNASL